jgi:hypothetical protein
MNIYLFFRCARIDVIPASYFLSAQCTFHVSPSFFSVEVTRPRCSSLIQCHDCFCIHFRCRGSSNAATSWGHINPFYEFSISSIVWQRRRNRSKQQRGSGKSYFSFAPVANLCGLYQYALVQKVLSE